MSKKVSETSKLASKDMEIGYLDPVGLEAACSDKTPTQIPPQQVSLLEKAIIQAKNSSSLGVVVESLKVMDGKKNQKKRKEGKAKQCSKNQSNRGTIGGFRAVSINRCCPITFKLNYF